MRQKLNIFLWLAGTDRDLIQHCTRRAIITQEVIGGMVLFTTLMAWISGSYAIWTFTHNSLVTLGGGALYAFGILIFDRFVVIASNKWMVILRLPLAIVIGLFIAIPLEALILQESIEKKLDQTFQADNRGVTERRLQALNEFADRQKSLQEKIDQEEAEVSRWSDIMEAETVGRVRAGRSGIAGQGPAFAEASRNMELHQKNALLARQDLTGHLATEPALQEKLRADSLGRTISRPTDLLARMAALGEVKKESSDGRLVANLLRGLLIIFELFPAFAKLFMDETEYNTLLNARTVLNKHQANTIANAGSERITKNPEDFEGLDEPEQSVLMKIKRNVMR